MGIEERVNERLARDDKANAIAAAGQMREQWSRDQMAHDVAEASALLATQAPEQMVHYFAKVYAFGHFGGTAIPDSEGPAGKGWLLRESLITPDGQLLEASFYTVPDSFDYGLPGSSRQRRIEARRRRDIAVANYPYRVSGLHENLSPVSYGFITASGSVLAGTRGGTITFRDARDFVTLDFQDWLTEAVAGVISSRSSS